MIGWTRTWDVFFYKPTIRKIEHLWQPTHSLKQKQMLFCSNEIWPELHLLCFKQIGGNTSKSLLCLADFFFVFERIPFLFCKNTVMEGRAHDQHSVKPSDSPTIRPTAAASLGYQCCNRSRAQWQHRVEWRWCQCWPHGAPGVSAPDENKQHLTLLNMPPFFQNRNEDDGKSQLGQCHLCRGRRVSPVGGATPHSLHSPAWFHLIGSD